MSEVVISVFNASKAYRIWHSSGKRLESLLLHGLKHLIPSLWDRCTAAQARRFRDFYALRDIGFEVRRGETIGIIGRNGSGKSTLLQVIAGTLSPNRGTVEVNGRVAALLELGSGFNHDFTGRENVYLNGAILGLSEAEMSARFESIAAFADIGEFIDQPVKTYSSGMVLRLAFAVVAHVDADILIVDEALAVGDAFFVQKCMRWIREFKERGTVLFVTHNAADVVALCDRAIWMRDGKIALDGSAKRVTEEYRAYFHVQDAAQRTPVEAIVAPVAPVPVAPAPMAEPVKPDESSFSFNLEQPAFGQGNARIIMVELCEAGDRRRPLNAIAGGERVTLRISAIAREEMSNPILGFNLKDRLGQYLFGENTFITNRSREFTVARGQIITAEFTFCMPLLPRGNYMFAAAVATGTQEAHVQQHWIHDALALDSINRDSHRGLVGILMENVSTSLTARLDSPPIVSFP
jgi:lipopolysaccharide transport system ATP-binding protein